MFFGMPEGDENGGSAPAISVNTATGFGLIAVGLNTIIILPF